MNPIFFVKLLSDSLLEKCSLPPPEMNSTYTIVHNSPRDLFYSILKNCEIKFIN